MSDMTQSYTDAQLVDRARHRFAGPLVISAASFMLFGYNIAQLLRYCSIFWRRDRVWTRVWVLLVSIVNGASIAYGGIYADYLVSIASWDPESSARDFALQSAVSSLLNGIVIFMVQLFWLTCLYRLLEPKPKLRWLIMVPIGLISLGSFAVSLALVAILTQQATYAVLAIQATLIKVSSALALGCDILVLAVIVYNLFSISRKARKLERSISRLTSTFCFVTLMSTLVLVAEIVIVSPSGSQTRYVIDFTFLYTAVYTTSMLAILNSRRILHFQSTELPFSSQRTSSLQASEARSQANNVIGFEDSLGNLFEKSPPRNVAVTISSEHSHGQDDSESK